MNLQSDLMESRTMSNLHGWLAAGKIFNTYIKKSEHARLDHLCNPLRFEIGNLGGGDGSMNEAVAIM